MKHYWPFLLLRFALTSATSICSSERVNSVTYLTGSSECEYEIKREAINNCKISVRSETNTLLLSTGRLTKLTNTTESELPVEFENTTIFIRNEDLTNFSIALVQKQCNCKTLSYSNYTATVNGTAWECYFVEKNSSNTCWLEIDLEDNDCGGSLEINGTSKKTGCLTQITKYELDHGMHLIFRKFNGMLALRQKNCTKPTNNLLTVLQSAPYQRDEYYCGESYRIDSFTLNKYGRGDCVFRVIKSNPDACRLRMSFIFFDSGFGDRGWCERGFLEVDGYNFCGCQSGLYWTTGIYTFRNNEAVIRYSNLDYTGGMRIEVNQESCYGPPRRYKRYTRARECRPIYPPWNIPNQIEEGCHNCEKEDECVMLKDKSGMISSYGPQEFSSNPICFEFADEGCGTVLKFHEFGIPVSPDCMDDYVLLNGKRFCGATLQSASVHLEENQISLKQSRPGNIRLVLQYIANDCIPREPTTEISQKEQRDHTHKELCDLTYDKTLFHIDQPGSKGCIYHVKKGDCKILELQISKLDIPCGQETLILNNQYYCGRIPKEIHYLTFTTNEIEIEHRLSPGVARATGKFHMAGLKKGCAQTSFSEERVSSCVTMLNGVVGQVMAPSLAPKPPKDLDCSYHIVPLSEMCFVKLDFGSVDIAASESCLKNYLEIKGKKYCGGVLSNTTQLLAFPNQTNPLELRYRIDKDLDFLNWDFKFTQIPCV